MSFLSYGDFLYVDCSVYFLRALVTATLQCFRRPPRGCTRR